MAKKQNSNKDIVDYYDQTAFDYKLAWYAKDNPALHFGFYDKEKADSHYEALSYTNRFLAERAGIKKGDRVLDAGCGHGGSSIWLAREYGVEAVGITLSGKQIAMCKENAETAGLSDLLDFQVADFCDTKLEDNSFDVVWAIESQCHAQKKAEFYNEMYRVLKTGGRLIVADYARKDRNLSAKDEELLTEKWLNNWAIGDIDSQDEHRSNLKSAGFQNFEISNVNDKVSVSLRNLHEKCVRSLPMERVLKFFRIRSAVQHGNLIASISQYKAFSKGLWDYVVIYAEK